MNQLDRRFRVGFDLVLDDIDAVSRSGSRFVVHMDGR
jgi:hypothetical protein